MQIERIEKTTREAFLSNYLLPNRPVIVTDAMANWAAPRKWTPAYLEQLFGDADVLVYNSLFDLLNVTTLSDYFASNFGLPAGQSSKEYVRWYSRLKSADLIWADTAFDMLKLDWATPYFLPVSGYSIPLCDAQSEIHPNNSLFPYRGLFISGRGSRTRLHRDPFTSSAVLCQFYGRKRVVLYHPQQAPYVANGREFVDPAAPDTKAFPQFAQAKPTYEDELTPGEILYIAAGWFHDVTCMSDSISITWNFVHESRAALFQRYAVEHPLDPELEIANFFLARASQAS